MNNFNSWNRRDFLARLTGALAASPLLGGSNFLFGQSTKSRPFLLRHKRARNRSIARSGKPASLSLSSAWV